MQEAETERLVAYLSEAYPRDEWSPNRLLLWMQHLADLEAEHTARAITTWIQTQNWPPTVAQIRELSHNYHREALGSRNLQLAEQSEAVEITPDQRAANLKQISQMVEKLKRSTAVGE